MSDARRQLGVRGEALAAERLAQAGYEIVARNYRCPRGEIDLVARERGEWVFVEVRTRRSDRWGTPEDSVTPRKQARLIGCAEHYLDAHGLGDAPWRIDVVAIEVARNGAIHRFEVIQDAVSG
ncbi:MAG: YraN family protein [Anaerolineales bacterium]